MEKISRLNDLEKKVIETLEKTEDLTALEELRKEYFGKKGIFSQALEDLKNLSPVEKQQFGKALNLTKEKMYLLIKEKNSKLEEAKFEIALTQKKPDWTLPSLPFFLGKTHPLTLVLDEVLKIFSEIGFSSAHGPEIETDENNFGALNIPEEHPARDMHDTFYIAGEKLLLRTHTSPVQIRVMKKQSPPIRIVAPGRVFRHEAVDATHSAVFHQVEGLAVDENISFADLKGTLEFFNKKLFGKEIKSRFRPSYFPFVEPGAEIDISCTICKSQKSNCPVCKGTGWIEMLGAGMVHPNVFKAVNIDPNQYTGFAFGLGIERIAMLKYGISELRLFYENHLDFLSQF
ncbi:MAG: phenylalanine--tRNA ligase subunit alpha [Elusimicrobia bacterium]|nr:phenylalanine--tRNA ligase subunit alpha [Elusimicrobiota bacterium]